MHVQQLLPAKAVPEMTYTGSGEMLNPTHSLTTLRTCTEFAPWLFTFGHTLCTFYSMQEFVALKVVNMFRRNVLLLLRATYIRKLCVW